MDSVIGILLIGFAAILFMMAYPSAVVIILIVQFVLQLALIFGAIYHGD